MACDVELKPDDAAIGRTQKLVAAGGILGAIAASSCCIAPLVLFSLGICGAWIGNLTAPAPYQPYFIAATLACLGYGYWLVYRRQNIACAEGEVCARPLPNQLVKTGLVLATVLVAGAIGLDARARSSTSPLAISIISLASWAGSRGRFTPSGPLGICSIFVKGHEGQR